MKKVTIITAGQGKGKTTKVKQLTENKKTYWIPSIHPGCLRYVPIDTDVIVIEDLIERDLPQIKSLITTQSLLVRPPYSNKIINLIRPEVICTSSVLTRSHFIEREHIEYIEM